MSDVLDAVIPAEFYNDPKYGRIYTQAEGGFRKGSKVRIRLDGDSWDGKTFTVGNVRTERTVDVTSGPKERYYCVGALRLISA